MIYDNVLDAMGQTPIIRLSRMNDEDSAEVLVKFEGLNVGGSIKTRTAYNMIKAAEKKGFINQDTIIVEPTSGNQGIGLALIGAVKGYKTVIIMPDSVSEERRKLVRHYGAEVILVHDAGNIGECIDECLQTALRMAKENPNVYVPQQFENEANPKVHKHHTALEIMEQVAGGNIGTHLQMGIGDGLIPPILNQNIYDDICIISDEEALQTSKDLAKKEGLMCGISSGTNVAAALKLAKKLGKGKTVVTVLPDTAERYFSTPLFENE